MELVLENDPILRKKCKRIERTYPLIENLILDMFNTMWQNKGIGLAAPQVGKSVQLFVVDTTRIHDRGIKQTFINAHIIDSSIDELLAEESCLSLPNCVVTVPRKKNIIVKYHDENFKQCIKKFENIEARVIQHELDHTKGILITDYVTTP